MQPYYGWFFFFLESRYNLSSTGFAQPCHRCGRGTELKKISAAVAFLLH
jgi:hypothetical protein